MGVKLFGGTGYLTMDPKNVESILLTNFEGLNLLHMFFVKDLQF